MKREEDLFSQDDYFENSKEKEAADRNNTLVNKMVAIGKPFFRSEFMPSPDQSGSMLSLRITDMKLLYMALTEIKWSQAGNKFDVRLRKSDICDVLDIPKDHRAANRIRNAYDHLARMSYLKMDINDRKDYKNGFLVFGSDSEERGEIINVHLNGVQFGTLFENLTGNKDFFVMWVNDIYRFTSIYSYLLYEDLRIHSDSRRKNSRIYTDEELKRVLRIPTSGKGSYMHMLKGKPHFNRNLFEKYILEPVTQEIADCRMVCLSPVGRKRQDGDRILPQKDNLVFYRKVKQNGKIAGYEFQYSIKTGRTKMLPDEE
ncbi:MAG: replication initiation protein [Parasporobacterium sp.]|nr:replication initiation protein [Parasporobacterium sp.]